MKKKIAIESIPTDSSFVDISCLSISSLAFLDRFTHIYTLDASRTQISNLKGVPNISSIANIKIAATPIAMLKHYRLMLLIVFGSKLSSIDDILVSNPERKLADSMRDSLRSFLFDGWVITKLNPTIIKKDNVEKIIDKETGIVKTKNITSKNPSSKTSKSTNSNNSSNKKKSSQQEMPAEEQPRRRLCPVFDFRNKPLFSQNQTINNHENAKETSSSSTVNNSDTSSPLNNKSPPSKIRQSLSSGEVSPTTNKSLINIDNNSENSSTNNIKNDDDKLNLSQNAQSTINNNDEENNDENIKTLQVSATSPKQNSNIKFSFSMTNSINLDRSNVEIDKSEYAWQSIFEISPKRYENIIANSKARQNKKDLIKNENKNQSNDNNNSMKIQNKSDINNKSANLVNGSPSLNEKASSEQSHSNRFLHNNKEEKNVSNKSKTVQNDELKESENNQKINKQASKIQKMSDIQKNANKNEENSDQYDGKLKSKIKIRKKSNKNQQTEEQLNTINQQDQQEKSINDQKADESVNSEQKRNGKSIENQSNKNDEQKQFEKLNKTQQKQNNNQKTIDKINNFKQKRQEKSFNNQQTNEISQKQTEKVNNNNQQIDENQKITQKRQQTSIIKAKTNQRNQEKMKFNKDPVNNNKNLNDNQRPTTKSNNDNEKETEKIQLKPKKTSRLQEKILNFLKSQKEEEEKNENEEEEEEFEFSDDQPPSMNLFDQWRKQTLNDESHNKSIQSTQKFINISNKEVESDDSYFNAIEEKRKGTLKARIEKIRRKVRNNQLFSDDDDNDRSNFERQKLTTSKSSGKIDLGFPGKRNFYHSKSDDDEENFSVNKFQSKSDDDENRNMSIKVCNALKQFRSRSRSDEEETRISSKYEKEERNEKDEEKSLNGKYQSKSDDESQVKSGKIFNSLKRLHSRSDDDDKRLSSKYQNKANELNEINENVSKKYRSKSDNEDEKVVSAQISKQLKNQGRCDENNNDNEDLITTKEIENININLNKYKSKSDDEDIISSAKTFNSIKRSQSRSDDDERRLLHQANLIYDKDEDNYGKNIASNKLTNNEERIKNNKPSKHITKVNMNNISRIYRKSNHDINKDNQTNSVENIPIESISEEKIALEDNNNSHPLPGNTNKSSDDNSNGNNLISDGESILNQIHLPSESAQIDEFLELEQYAQNALSESQDISENQFESENDFEIEYKKTNKEETKAVHRFNANKTEYDDEDIDDYNDNELDDDNNFNESREINSEEAQSFNTEYKDSVSHFGVEEEEENENHNYETEIQEDENESRNYETENRFDENESRNFETENHFDENESHNYETENQEDESHNYETENHFDENKKHVFEIENQNDESLFNNETESQIQIQDQSFDMNNHEEKELLRNEDQKFYNKNQEIDDYESDNQRFFVNYQDDENIVEDEESDNQSFFIKYQDTENENENEEENLNENEIYDDDDENYNYKNEDNEINRKEERNSEADIVSPTQCIVVKDDDGYEIDDSEEGFEALIHPLNFESSYIDSSTLNQQEIIQQEMKRKALQKVRSPTSVIRSNATKKINKFGKSDDFENNNEQINSKINFSNNESVQKRPKLPPASDLLSIGNDEEAEIIMPSDFFNDLQLSICLSEGNEEDEEEEARVHYRKNSRKNNKDKVKPVLKKNRIYKEPKLNQNANNQFEEESQKVPQKLKLNLKDLKKKILKNRKLQRQKNNQNQINGKEIKELNDEHDES